MVLVLSCGVLAGGLLLFAPLVLTRGRWQVRFPRLAFASWFGAFLVGCALALGSLVAMVAASLSASSSMDAAAATVVTVGTWLSLGAIGAIAAFVSVSAEPLADSHREAISALAAVALSREERRGFTLVRFASEEPVACAVPGRRPEILVSTGLEMLLSAAQLQAVLAHEYAHLRYGHGWAVRVAEVNALCLPRFLRAGRGLRRATLLLVELIADDAAARQAGAANLANALDRMAKESGDAGLALRAERLALRRWPRASHRRVPEPIRLPV
ncbi:M48 family metalloprotease [Microbacterium sp. NIBRBAC000506063]|uniref:M48 family metalloprotease n=1 Tax=Microbacterium sp. NIBRBAC000506063 TaxID=2734618 RepID=UPI001BB60DB4|nr:M48 family metalloprotease [Microbacterium sp. NIBRBAC000506063]QTV80355.1 M48 family metalloprotease [Microbacterium sp. NIBRBAC000506063]